jgi:hypothetical protein
MFDEDVARNAPTRKNIARDGIVEQSVAEAMSGSCEFRVAYLA